ncbi:MAG TPA: MBL fold metallo-hydrolase [Candidatus Gracilibacteria bacterium]|nr:MBL fold metallo-hydrolase [Candidatus Gracilibacteria bacterium]
MKIKFCGAAKEVTGSRHLLEVNGKKILLDCGLFQGHRKEAEAKNRELCFDAKEIDAVILSHAHIDHSGGLPFLIKNGFKGPIFSTFATRDLANYMLLDSAFIQEKDAEYMNLRNKNKKKGEPPIEPLYSLDDAAKTLEHFYAVSYEKAFVVTDGVVCSFYDAGHILGSALVHLIIYDKEKDQRYTLAFTGDLGRKNLPILRDPQPLPPTDFLLTESTYGDRLHESMLDAGKKLADTINRTVQRGGKILVPAFAVERTQEIVYHLNKLWNEKKIPDVPIYVDSPLAANVTEVFVNHPECYDHATFMEFIQHRKNPFGFGRLQYTRDVSESKALNELNGPAIIISASGMCENGRILHHLKNNIEDPRNTIMIVGFMARDTLGRKLLEKQPMVNIFGEPYHLRAEVVQMDAFSGHADRSDLLDYIKNIEGLKKIFLVHGEEEQAGKFKEYLGESGYKDVIQPGRGETYEIP